MSSASPRLLDLFCCEGGAGEGYRRAGFEVVGVDIKARDRYPFEFVQADALGFPLDGYDAIHASPPCQVHSTTKNWGSWDDGAHEDLIGPTRSRLRASGLPYVIENVIGAPLLHPTMLCGEMFGLRLHRHRLFECSFLLPQPHHPIHRWRAGWEGKGVGRAAEDDQAIVPVGHFPNVALVREVMGMAWASQYGLAQAIPPAYTEYIGHALMAHLRGEGHEQLTIEVAA